VLIKVIPPLTMTFTADPESCPLREQARYAIRLFGSQYIAVDGSKRAFLDDAYSTWKLEHRLVSRRKTASRGNQQLALLASLALSQAYE
jgi:hypothetical protein